MVDDALKLNHEDIKDILWYNPGEIANNSTDDDNNGFIDDINGWDMAHNDNDVNPGTYFTNWKRQSHGTHCAGIIGATTNNNKGIASIGYGVRIMPVKISSDTTGGLVNPFAGVQYAIRNKADIISMSWGGGWPTLASQLLFNVARDSGILCIAAAGNNNWSNKMYPASYANVMSVGATDSFDLKASFSNYGDSVDVMAPGVSIYSSITKSTNSYDYFSGTSMACPLVAGLAGLIKSENQNLSVKELESILYCGCDSIYSYNSSYLGQLGRGRINAEKSLINCMKYVVADFTANLTRVCKGSKIKLINQSKGDSLKYKWYFKGANLDSSTLEEPEIIFNSIGVFDIMFIAYNSKQADTVLKSKFITVAKPFAYIDSSSIQKTPKGGYAHVPVYL